jgi:hypothetical protein
MNDEQKRKEDLEAAKGWLAIAKKDNNAMAIQILENLFPELKESEDERIRKEIIAFLKYYHTGQGNCVIYDNDWIDWLEKQGNRNEQNFWKKCNHCEYFDGYGLCLHKNNFGSVTDELKENCKNNKFFTEKQGEEKPAEWSEEDEKILEDIADFLKYPSVTPEKKIRNKFISWLKSIKPNHWKPSEEQLRAIINSAQGLYQCKEKEVLLDLYEQLKNL